MSITITSTIITHLHSQREYSQDVKKDVRYQSTSQSIDQSVLAQINQTSQSVDQSALVIQTSLRQASLQSLYSQLSYNSLYAAINQSYHLYNRSPYAYASINQYALLESPRSSYVSNQIRFTPQAPQSNLPQPIQPAPQSSQSPQSSSFSSASTSLIVFEPIHINQSFNDESSQSFNELNQSFIDSNDWFRQLTLLNKIYKKNEKFSDTNSNFDFKVLKFYDKCRRAKLPEHAYLQSVSIMFTNETLDYYYANLQFCYSFHKFCVNIKHYFEDSE